eukprot:scaffold950_cov360-Pavlova_lutheri.AAC.42
MLRTRPLSHSMIFFAPLSHTWPGLRTGTAWDLWHRSLGRRGGSFPALSRAVSRPAVLFSTRGRTLSRLGRALLRSSRASKAASWAHARLPGVPVRPPVSPVDLSLASLRPGARALPLWTLGSPWTPAAPDPSSLPGRLAPPTIAIRRRRPSLCVARPPVFASLSSAPSSGPIPVRLLPASAWRCVPNVLVGVPATFASVVARRQERSEWRMENRPGLLGLARDQKGDHANDVRCGAGHQVGRRNAGGSTTPQQDGWMDGWEMDRWMTSQILLPPIATFLGQGLFAWSGSAKDAGFCRCGRRFRFCATRLQVQLPAFARGWGRRHGHIFPLAAHRSRFLVTSKALGPLTFPGEGGFGTCTIRLFLHVLDRHWFGVSEDAGPGGHVGGGRHLFRLFASWLELKLGAFSRGCGRSTRPAFLCVGMGRVAWMRVRGCGRLELLGFAPVVHFVCGRRSQIIHRTIVEPEPAAFLDRWAGGPVSESEAAPFFAFTESASSTSCVAGGGCELLSFGPIVHLVGT